MLIIDWDHNCTFIDMHIHKHVKYLYTYLYIKIFIDVCLFKLSIALSLISPIYDNNDDAYSNRLESTLSHRLLVFTCDRLY